MMTPTGASNPSAREVGNKATHTFLHSAKSVESQSQQNISQERVRLLAGALIQAANDIAEKYEVTYQEYNILKAWLIQVGDDGEWPLFLDVWLEHTIEAVNTRSRQGTIGTIEGPYYVPDAPEMVSPATLPMRVDEQGTDLIFTGSVQDVQGNTVADAVIDMWHADSDGYYSQFVPGLPEWNLRARVHADATGQFEIHTRRPGHYRIATDGACGQLLDATGWSPWRPAHVHVKVSAPGYLTVTQQLYFPDDPHTQDDIATAVKPELILDPQPNQQGGHTVTYNYVLDPA